MFKRSPLSGMNFFSNLSRLPPEVQAKIDAQNQAYHASQSPAGGYNPSSGQWTDQNGQAVAQDMAYRPPAGTPAPNIPGMENIQRGPLQNLSPTQANTTQDMALRSPIGSIPNMPSMENIQRGPLQNLTPMQNLNPSQQPTTMGPMSGIGGSGPSGGFTPPMGQPQPFAGQVSPGQQGGLSLGGPQANTNQLQPYVGGQANQLQPYVGGQGLNQALSGIGFNTPGLVNSFRTMFRGKFNG